MMHSLETHIVQMLQVPTPEASGKEEQACEAKASIWLQATEFDGFG